MSNEHAAEIALLGAFLLDSKLMDQEEPLVTTPAIFSPTGQALYRAIAACYERNSTVDIVLVMSEVANGDQERIQAMAAEAVDSCPMSKNARFYADILERKFRKADALSQSQALIEAITEDDPPARVREHLDAIGDIVGGVEGRQQLEPYDLREIIDEPDTPVPYVVKGWLSTRDFAVIGGEPGTGKSVFALDLAVALASGGRFLDTFDIERQYKVVYLDEEMAPILARRRIRQLVRGRQLEPEDVALYYYNGFHLKVDSIEGRLRLRRICEKCSPDWIVMDSLIRFHRKNENDNTEMSKVYELIKEMQEEHDTGVICLHHLAKPSKDKSKELGHRLRGASDLRAAVDQLWGIEGETSTDVRCLVHAKNRWGRESIPMSMVWAESDDEATATLTGDTQARSAETIVSDVLYESGVRGCSRSTIIKVLRADYTEASASKIATTVLGKLKGTGEARAQKMGRRTHYWHKDHAPQRAFDDVEGGDGAQGAHNR